MRNLATILIKKILQKRLNETKNLYDDLRRQKENLENNYDQLRFDYKNDMKKAEMVSTLV